ncbi:hypothetical protein O7632_13880 [Solwaraspora sp. WMMD406]|uniref:hypothetical protein n=1 Tax=Solwaraspora sp. WMMD406 TaxID=3016095 RepID=UPI0024161EDE|nr:hypothetical protein [Solwaraspora sp. WMMD406]MDG4765177.1 hypothetical protein [Solwaraspora sp. WMMD406]
MAGSDPHSARAEAERLVATALAMAKLAARGQRHGSAGLGALRDLLGATGPIATGEPACCVCPLCRLIDAMRDPSPELAERLATGAGDLAAGAASLLRALAPTEPAPQGGWGAPAPPDAQGEPAPSRVPTEPAPPDAQGEPAPPRGPSPDSPATTVSSPRTPPSGQSAPDDEVWRWATRTRDDSGSAGDRDVWSAATHVPVDVAGASTPPVGRDGVQRATDGGAEPEPSSAGGPAEPDPHWADRQQPGPAADGTDPAGPRRPESGPRRPESGPA